MLGQATMDAVARSGTRRASARLARSALQSLAWAASLAIVVCGCGVHVPAYTLGRYHAADGSLFVQVGRALLDQQYALLETDEPHGRIRIESRWHHRRVHASITIEVAPEGWIVIRPGGDEVAIESDGYRVHPALAYEVERLALHLREGLDARVIARVASTASPPTAAVNPRTHRHPRASLVIAGNLTLTAGWVGSIGVGLAVLGLDGRSGCADDYAGMHWAPIVGSIAGLVHATTSCGTEISPALLALDVLSGAVQLAGVILTILGLAMGEESIVLDGPAEIEIAIAIAPLVDPSTIGAAVAVAY